jgi:hypothetical protein
MASITVRRSLPEEEAGVIRQSYDMKVEVINAVDMPEEIFCFHHGVAPARSGMETEATDEFKSVADPVDLEEYPVEAPDLLNEIPFYRVSEVTLRFRSMIELEETWGYIAEDIQGLVTALNINLNAPETEDFTFS